MTDQRHGLQGPGVLVPNDGNNCRDNEIGNLFNIASSSPSIGKWFGMTEADWNCEMHRGGFGTMLKVTNYNGKKNDQAVRLDVYTSLGLRDLNNVPWRCRTSIESASRSRVAQSRLLAAQRTLENRKVIDCVRCRGRGQRPAEFEDLRLGRFRPERLSVRSAPGRCGSVVEREVHCCSGFPPDRPSGHDRGRAGQDQNDLWTVDHGLIAGVVNAGEMLQTFREIGLCENLCGTFDQVKRLSQRTQGRHPERRPHPAGYTV